jgi:hypothetical protein
MSNVVSITKSDPPDFITRVDIDKMSDEELTELVSAIRARRMKNFVVYQATVKEKKEVKQEKLVNRMETKCEQIVKKLAAIDKQFEALEKYVNELRGLRIEAQLNPMI